MTRRRSSGVSVLLVRGATPQLYRQEYDNVREGDRSGDVTTELPGLGDQAFIHVAGRRALLGTRKGNVLLMISVEDPFSSPISARTSAEERRVKLITLARIALGRI